MQKENAESVTDHFFLCIDFNVVNILSLRVQGCMSANMLRSRRCVQYASIYNTQSTWLYCNEPSFSRVALGLVTSR